MERKPVQPKASRPNAIPLAVLALARRPPRNGLAQPVPPPNTVGAVSAACHERSMNPCHPPRLPDRDRAPSSPRSPGARRQQQTAEHTRLVSRTPCAVSTPHQAAPAAKPVLPIPAATAMFHRKNPMHRERRPRAAEPADRPRQDSPRSHGATGITAALTPLTPDAPSVTRWLRGESLTPYPPHQPPTGTPCAVRIPYQAPPAAEPGLPIPAMTATLHRQNPLHRERLLRAADPVDRPRQDSPPRHGATPVMGPGHPYRIHRSRKRFSCVLLYIVMARLVRATYRGTVRRGWPGQAAYASG